MRNGFRGSHGGYWGGELHLHGSMPMHAPWSPTEWRGFWLLLVAGPSGYSENACTSALLSTTIRAAFVFLTAPTVRPCTDREPPARPHTSVPTVETTPSPRPPSLVSSSRALPPPLASHTRTRARCTTMTDHPDRERGRPTVGKPDHWVMAHPSGLQKQPQLKPQL